MRVFFHRIRHRRRSVARPVGLRSAACRPLLPWQVREQRFRPTQFGRRGLDPQEVQEFLDRLAGDLAAVYDALAQSRRETSRIKVALCHLQSERAHVRNEREWGR
ncbi:DivIVA domain-containing protein [Micromonospora sp. NBC_01405]|uniref:DivIVA domain-containing protein n=1 Tax=Micromonospora sp. NBC_01405 TaxID=2903589 RepID=UPI00324A2A33